MICWDDIAKDFNKATLSFERVIKAFKSLTKTYEEFIEYCRNEFLHSGKV